MKEVSTLLIALVFAKYWREALSVLATTMVFLMVLGLFVVVKVIIEMAA